MLFIEEDIFYYNERWHCYEVHSARSTSSKEELLANLNQILYNTKKQLQEATHFIITYGTSWVYRDISTNKIVANCHKVSQKQFAKELLSIEIIKESIDKTIRLIQVINPDCHFIFTVSPVRHLKDGFVENQLSKAHLITAIHQIVNNRIGVPPSGAEGAYFPSYEIMMDELRDYRFYAQDMLHPSQIAIDYIWEQFLLTQITDEIYSTMNEVCNIQKGFLHRPFNPNSKSHEQFLSKLQDKIALVQKQFPQIQF